MIATNEYGAYAVPRTAAHRPAAQAVLGGAVWEPQTIELLRGCDPSGDIVHAGTFFGDFLPALAGSRQGGARIWAFEPNYENYRCARVTLILNDLDNVVLTHAALDATAGAGRLAVRSVDGVALGGGSYVVDAAGEHASTENVRLTAVDDCVPADRHVAMVQLDVEGHERQALLGASTTIRRCRPTLVVETAPERAWFARHFGDCGYEVVGEVCGNTILRAKRQRP